MDIIPKPKAAQEFPMTFEHVQAVAVLPDGALVIQSTGAVVEILGLDGPIDLRVHVYSTLVERLAHAAADPGGRRPG